MSTQAQQPMTLERYEFKYLIPWSYVEPISLFVEPYCELDHHSSHTDDHFYTVNSLYFDTPGCEFLKQRLWGRIHRFNMRVRTYGDGTRPPYYLEIKHKKNLCIRKYRAAARAEEWPRILMDPGYRVGNDHSPAERANKERFLNLATSYGIEPKILTSYRRRAFFSTVDDYARLTMDIALRYRNESSLCTALDDNMSHYDHENTFVANFTSDTASVVLELKCVVGQVPIWMLDLVRHFQLKQQGFSKYMQSMLTANGGDATRFMDCDRRPIEVAYS